MLQSMPSTPTQVYQAIPWVSPVSIHTWCSSCSCSRVHSPKKNRGPCIRFAQCCEAPRSENRWCHWMFFFFFSEDLMRQLPKMMRKRSWGLKQLKIKSMDGGFKYVKLFYPQPFWGNSPIWLKCFRWVVITGSKCIFSWKEWNPQVAWCLRYL